MLDRRDFLTFAGSAAAALHWPGPIQRRRRRCASRPPRARPLRARRGGVLGGDPQAVPHPAGRGLPEQRHRGVVSWPVLRAVFEGYRQTERMAQDDPEDYPIWGYGPWNEFRDPLAKFIGCSRDELALVRNATEANSYDRERHRPQGGRRGLDQRPGAPGRRAALEPARQALRHRGEEVRPASAPGQRGRDPHQGGRRHHPRARASSSSATSRPPRAWCCR